MAKPSIIVPAIGLGLGVGVMTLLLRRKSDVAPTVQSRPVMSTAYVKEAVLLLEYMKASAEGIGTVLPLTPEQVVNRAMFLIGERTLAELDQWVMTDAKTLAAWGYTSPSAKCLALYYQLPPPINGGRNPRAPDPAARWHFEGRDNINRTADCTGGVSWMLGQDRYAPKVASGVIKQFEGWINVDSRIRDALDPKRQCFQPLLEPALGCVIGFESGAAGHTYGHEGIVVGLPSRPWDPSNHVCWEELQVINCAALGAEPCNVKVSGRWWEGPWLDGKKTHFTSSMRDPTV